MLFAHCYCVVQYLPKTRISSFIAVAALGTLVATAKCTVPGNSSSSSKSDNALQLAYPMPVKGHYRNSRYGYRIHPIHGDKRWHDGDDMTPGSGNYSNALPGSLPHGGNTLYAVAQCTVASYHDACEDHHGRDRRNRCGQLRGYGNHVALDCPSIDDIPELEGPGTRGSFTTRLFYAHLNKVSDAVKNAHRSGKSIAPCTVIGKIGSTGQSTGPHLHFEHQRIDAKGGLARTDPGALLRLAESKGLDCPVDKPAVQNLSPIEVNWHRFESATEEEMMCTVEAHAWSP